MLLLDWHHLCFCFLCLFSIWLVILFYFPSFCKAQPFGCPAYISICIVLNISGCSFASHLSCAEPEWQALRALHHKAPLASVADVNFPATSFCISTVRCYSSLSSLFIILPCYWKLLGIFFLSSSLFAFLPVLTVMSLAQISINSCFALHQFFLSALEVLHTDCLYEHQLFLRHHSPGNIPDFHWHHGVRLSLFCLSSWSST